MRTKDSHFKRIIISWTLPLTIVCGYAIAAESSWQERLDHAEQLSGAGKIEESVKAAQGALADAEKDLGPENPEVIHILARLSRIYEAAADPRLPQIEKRLSAVKSKDFEVWLALGMLLHFEQKPLEAENALKKALAFRPEDREAESELALVYDEMGRFEEEIRLLTGFLKKWPQDDYSLFSQLARVYAHLGRFSEAKETFVQARKLNGESAAAYINEGYFHLQVGESAQAKEAFESAIALDTASPQGYHHMGTYFSDHQQLPEAEKYYRQALKIMEASPNADARPLVHTIGALGRVLQAQGRQAEAEAVLRKCLEKAPPTEVSATCLSSLGEIYASQGENAQAEDLFKRAAAVCEEGTACTCRGNGLIGLGDFYLNQGRNGEAAAIADQAGRLCAANRSYDLSVLLALAGLYVRLGDVSKGEALYGRILSISRSIDFNGTLAPALKQLADLKMTRGRFHEAEDLYRKAIPILENHRDVQQEAETLNALSGALEKEGKHQEAGEAREKAEALKPGAFVPSG